MFVFQEGLRAGEQVLMLLGKKQGPQQSLRSAAGSFFCVCFPPYQPYTCSFCLKITPPPARPSPRAHQPSLYFSLFLLISSVLVAPTPLERV